MTELTSFVSDPHLEFVVHLGEDKALKSSAKKNKSSVADHLSGFDGLVMLDLPTTRIEFRGDGPSSGQDSYAPIARLQWTALFKQADKNKDGFIDEKEAKSSVFADAFKAMDRDGDGKVSEEEFTAYLDFLADLQGRAKKACVSLVLSDESRGLFDLLDVNRDGRLSVREMRAVPGCSPNSIGRARGSSRPPTCLAVTGSRCAERPELWGGRFRRRDCAYLWRRQQGTGVPRRPKARSGFARWTKTATATFPAANGSATRRSSARSIPTTTASSAPWKPNASTPRCGIDEGSIPCLRGGLVAQLTCLGGVSPARCVLPAPEIGELRIP